MKTTLPEQKQAEKLLQRNKIQLHDIKSFSFMERYHQAPRKDSRVSKDKYGAGILTLHLIQSADKSIYLTPFRHPTSVIRYLVSNGIPNIADPLSTCSTLSHCSLHLPYWDVE